MAGADQRHCWRNREAFCDPTMATMHECLNMLESYDIRPWDKHLKIPVISHRFHDPPRRVRVEILKRALKLADKQKRRVKYVRFDQLCYGFEVKVRFTTRPDERDLTQPGKWWNIVSPGREEYLRQKRRDPQFPF